jgi:hypothetical protein
LAGKIPDFQSADGASISIDRNYLTAETTVNVQGVLSYVLFKDTRVNEGKYGPGELYVSGYAFAPFIEVDSSRSSSQPQPTKDKLVFGGLGQLELFSGAIFDRQLVTGSAYYQTDFYQNAEIYGGKVTWEPQLLQVGLGSITRFTDVFDFNWRTFAAADYRNVGDPGRTGLKADSDYFWLGGGAILKVWPFPDLLKSRVFLEAYPSYYYDTVTRTPARMFTGTAGVTIDPDGHAAAQVKYQDGLDYSTGVTSKRVVGELTVKY